MVARIHDTYYDTKATLLSDDAIKEIRESRECLQQGAILSQPVLDENFKNDKSEQNLEAVPEVPSTSTLTMKIPKKNGQKKKVSLELEIRQEKNENKDDVVSNNLPDVSQEKRLESLLENLVNRGEKLKSSVGTFDISST
ncbi:hypothetical protein F8M41_015796 [Gigaspora margarita]|uniref:Uncharacterized protein n=1 Tax=Gigaspora margarita TaxID=4874 RepID=A0A8H4AQC1_GIGMA|nr:hypothetical protein F8M41_015796 [Gigaspora margarita]